MTLAIAELKYPLETVVKAYEDPEVKHRVQHAGEMTDEKQNEQMEVFLKETNGDIERELSRIVLVIPALSDREFVQEKKKFKNYLGDPKKVLITMKSINHEKYPITSKYTRAECYVGGYYFEAVDDNTTRMLYVNHADMKFNWLVYKVVKAKMIGSTDHFFEELNQCCEFIQNGKLPG